jgi:hypothetical protein
MKAALLFLQAATGAMAPAPTMDAMRQQVTDAYRQEEARQDALPPAKDDAEKIIRLGTLDQVGRITMMKLDWSSVPADQQPVWRGAILAEISRHDRLNQERLKMLIPEEGWFRISLYGKEAARAAFLIVQHAVDDPALMRGTLNRMEALLPLYDRVAMTFDKKPQRYGTQVNCVDGRWQPTDLEAPDAVNTRRQAVGMTQTIEQYLAMFDNAQCPKA